MWSNRQQHAFHFALDAMNNCRLAFAVPSMWTPIVQTVSQQKRKYMKTISNEQEQKQRQQQQLFTSSGW